MTPPRDTKQRQAICRALEEAGRPLGPAEIHRAARRHARNLGMATVYRAVRQLVAEKWLVEVALPGEPSRYERAGKRHHHHFHCRGCDRVYEIDGCPGGLASLLPRGFTLERHEVVLYGRCASCGGA